MHYVLFWGNSAFLATFSLKLSKYRSLGLTVVQLQDWPRGNNKDRIPKPRKDEIRYLTGLLKILWSNLELFCRITVRIFSVYDEKWLLHSSLTVIDFKELWEGSNNISVYPMFWELLSKPCCPNIAFCQIFLCLLWSHIYGMIKTVLAIIRDLSFVNYTDLLSSVFKTLGDSLHFLLHMWNCTQGLWTQFW